MYTYRSTIFAYSVNMHLPYMQTVKIYDHHVIKLHMSFSYYVYRISKIFDYFNIYITVYKTNKMIPIWIFRRWTYTTLIYICMQHVAK